MFGKAIVRGLSTTVLVCWVAVAQADVFNMDPGLTSLEMVPVGDPGNAADSTGFGTVGYAYQMGKYDVTVAQYCQFLNAVAATDPYGLYSSDMAAFVPSGIARSGSPGNYAYAVRGDCSQAANCPIVSVCWGDAARFCNWLQNGQPAGAQGDGTTETGAYTLNGAVSDAALMTISRNAGARYFIPSENEWYKAAYYDPTLNGGTGGYWAYPTRSNTAPINILSSTSTNNANFHDDFGTGNGDFTDPVNYLTPVGAFAASPGPYGTYDMGGDVYQWNETNEGWYRGLRGGCWSGNSYGFVSYNRHEDNPGSENILIGFRVASVPEPSSLVMLVGIALAALLYWRRKGA